MVDVAFAQIKDAVGVEVDGDGVGRGAGALRVADFVERLDEQGVLRDLAFFAAFGGVLLGDAGEFALVLFFVARGFLRGIFSVQAVFFGGLFFRALGFLAGALGFIRFAVFDLFELLAVEFMGVILSTVLL